MPELDPFTTAMATDLGLERIIVVHHPDRGKIAEQCAAELRESNAVSHAGISHIDQWPTVDCGHTNNAEMLLEKGAREGDCFFKIGGDGTLRILAGAVVYNKELAALNIPITAVNGGNADDGRKAFHGRRKAPADEIFTSSLALTAHLLDVTTIYEGAISTSYAVSYVGCGKTALATLWLASDEYRNGWRPVQDAKLGMGALTSSHSFTIAMPGEAPITLGDQTISISPYMAKIFQFPTVRHWHPTMRVTQVRPGVPRSVRAGIGLVLGRAAGFDTSAPVVFDTHTDMPMHFDGEPAITVPADSRVAISTGHHTYTVLASRYPLNPPSVS